MQIGELLRRKPTATIYRFPTGEIIPPKPSFLTQIVVGVLCQVGLLAILGISIVGFLLK